MQQKGLTQEETTKRLICFGADATSIFQGYYARVTFQFKEKFALYMMGQHCMAHWTNLAIQVLSNMAIVAKLENLLQSLYSYFSNSPKCHLEFTKLVEIMEIGRLKIL